MEFIPPKQDIRVMTSPLSEAVMQRGRNILSIVEDALKNQRVLLAVQPIIQSRAQHNVAFYEALLRVSDTSGRIIPAGEFIHLIEDTEIGRTMDCLALEKGLRMLIRQPDLRLSINMSARSIGYARWIKSLDYGLKRDPTVGERLILEVTEHSAMQVPELAVNFMSHYHAKGLSFALDDFGAGQTSFRYLKNFHFDMVKIDGEFIKGISENPDNQVITAALLSVAQQFDMVTVAEFVENKQDVDYLTQLGIDCLQGYYFAAPTISPPWLDKSEKRA